MRIPAVVVAISVVVLYLTEDVCSLQSVSRRKAFDLAIQTSSVAGLAVLAAPSKATAEPTKNGLAARLARKDPAELKNRIFNIPPTAQVYPSWLRGSWKITSNLNGYLFPSSRIPKERVTQNFQIPGFQKCSIVQTADVGKDNVQYEMRIDEKTGLEDRIINFQSSINGYLGYKAVSQVLYDVKANPNRISIDFVDYKTVNAERVELFCNARESEEYTRDGEGTPIFVCSEYARQVTFGTGSNVGVPRQVVTNYAHFWTYKQMSDNSLQGNLLTAGYLDPQDPMFFEEPQLPVVIYSHVFQGERQTG